MYKTVVAVVSVALYALLAVLAGVVTDFHDRYQPQALGITHRVALDFSRSPMAREDAFAALRQAQATRDPGIYRLLPDLSDTSSQVFVDFADPAPQTIGWFGSYHPAELVGTERLRNTSPDGTYLVRNLDGLAPTLDAFRDQGVQVSIAAASPTSSLLGLSQQAGFAAPVLAACALVAALTVFWLAVRARARALRVLGGAPPWRIQVQDLGAFVGVLVGTALLVGAGAVIAVGLTRGWVYTTSYATILGLFMGVTLAACLAIMLALSAASWPSAALFAWRRPAVSSLKWPARVIQVVTLAILILLSGPAWVASQEAAQTARQLAVWNEFADQVALSFGMPDAGLIALEPRVAPVIAEAEEEGAAALSYTILAADRHGDFEGWSAISIVNPAWVALVGRSVGPDALQPVPRTEVETMLARELIPSLEVWNGTKDATATLSTLTLLRPSPGVEYPVADGGSRGRLSFLDDVLVVQVPRISAVFDDSNTTSLATSANIVLTGARQTEARLAAAGLDEAGLSASGIEGTLQVLHMAEQGIVEAQFATYLAGLLAASLVALAVAFLVAAVVNALVLGLLHAHRDFPLRLAGRTWEQVVRTRALRDVGLAAALTLVFTLVAPPGARVVTAVVGLVAALALFVAHVVVASAIFTGVTHRRF